MEICITAAKVMIKKLTLLCKQAPNDLQVFVLPLQLWQVPNCKLNHTIFFSDIVFLILNLYFYAVFLYFSGTFFCFLIVRHQTHLYWAICKANFSQVSDSSIKFCVYFGFQNILALQFEPK